jgi:hypothetical protein
MKDDGREGLPGKLVCCIQIPAVTWGGGFEEPGPKLNSEPEHHRRARNRSSCPHDIIICSLSLRVSFNYLTSRSHRLALSAGGLFGCQPASQTCQRTDHEPISANSSDKASVTIPVLRRPQHLAIASPDCSHEPLQLLALPP